jgi:hypothetical protein
MPVPLDYASKSGTSRLSRLAILAFGVSFLCVPVAMSADYLVISFAQGHGVRVTRDIARNTATGLWAMSILSALLLSVTALVRIRRAGGSLRGKPFARISMWVCLFWLVFFGALLVGT